MTENLSTIPDKLIVSYIYNNNISDVDVNTISIRNMEGE